MQVGTSLCLPEPAVGAFGEKLRNRREQRGLALEAISNTTKISTRMLRALEEEDFDQLPGGVFNKGFVRAYARQVGINEEEAISDYLLALRENQIAAQKLLPDFRVSAPPLREVPATLPPSEVASPFPREMSVEQNPIEDRNRKDKDKDGDEIEAHLFSYDPPRVQKKGNNHRPVIAESITQRAAQSAIEPAFEPVTPAPPASPTPRIPWIRLGLVLLFVAALLVLWNSYRRATSASARSASASPATSQQPDNKISESPTAHEIHELPRNEPPKSVAVPVTDKASPRPVVSHPLVSHPVNRPTPVANPAIRKPAVKLPSTFTVSIRAAKNTSVSILADGKPFVQETLIAPAHTSVRATREVVVKVGDAAGISFSVNGNPLSVPVNEGEARTYVFGAHGLLTGQVRAPATNR